MALAVASLLVNIQTEDQLAAQDAPPGLVAQLVASYALNGALWALLAVWAGITVRRWWLAALYGIALGELALLLHYLLGMTVGFFTWADVLDNGYWFVVGAVLCGPMGVIGWVARRDDTWDWLARAVVPVGLIAEQLRSWSFVPSPYERRSIAVAGQVWAWTEVTAGAVLLVLLVVRWRAHRRSRSARPT